MTELAIAYSLYMLVVSVALESLLERVPWLPRDWQPHLRTTFKRCTDRSTSTFFSDPLREVPGKYEYGTCQELLFFRREQTSIFRDSYINGMKMISRK